MFARDDSTGLTIIYDPTLGDDLWEMDVDRGVISFNTVHPTWVRMDEVHGNAVRSRARRIQRLQAEIIGDVLTTLSKFADWSGLSQDNKDIIWDIVATCVNTRTYMTVEADKRVASAGSSRQPKDKK